MNKEKIYIAIIIILSAFLLYFATKQTQKIIVNLKPVGSDIRQQQPFSIWDAK